MISKKLACRSFVTLLLSSACGGSIQASPNVSGHHGSPRDGEYQTAFAALPSITSLARCEGQREACEVFPSFVPTRVFEHEGRLYALGTSSLFVFRDGSWDLAHTFENQVVANPINSQNTVFCGASEMAKLENGSFSSVPLPPAWNPVFGLLQCASVAASADGLVALSGASFWRLAPGAQSWTEISLPQAGDEARWVDAEAFDYDGQRVVGLLDSRCDLYAVAGDNSLTRIPLGSNNSSAVSSGGFEMVDECFALYPMQREGLDLFVAKQSGAGWMVSQNGFSRVPSPTEDSGSQGQADRPLIFSAGSGAPVFLSQNLDAQTRQSQATVHVWNGSEWMHQVLSGETLSLPQEIGRAGSNTFYATIGSASRDRVRVGISNEGMQSIRWQDEAFGSFRDPLELNLNLRPCSNTGSNNDLCSEWQSVHGVRIRQQTSVQTGRVRIEVSTEGESQTLWSLELPESFQPISLYAQNPTRVYAASQDGRVGYAESSGFTPIEFASADQFLQLALLPDGETLVLMNRSQRLQLLQRGSLRDAPGLDTCFANALIAFEDAVRVACIDGRWAEFRSDVPTWIQAPSQEMITWAAVRNGETVAYNSVLQEGLVMRTAGYDRTSMGASFAESFENAETPLSFNDRAVPWRDGLWIVRRGVEGLGGYRHFLVSAPAPEAHPWTVRRESFRPALDAAVFGEGVQRGRLEAMMMTMSQGMMAGAVEESIANARLVGDANFARLYFRVDGELDQGSPVLAPSRTWLAPGSANSRSEPSPAALDVLAEEGLQPVAERSMHCREVSAEETRLQQQRRGRPNLQSVCTALEDQGSSRGWLYLLRVIGNRELRVEMVSPQNNLLRLLHRETLPTISRGDRYRVAQVLWSTAADHRHMSLRMRLETVSTIASSAGEDQQQQSLIGLRAFELPN